MMARRTFAWLALVGCAFVSGWARAQDPAVLSPAPLNIPVPAAAPGQDGPTPTLHVYTNLAQIPTLILSTSHDRARRFDTSRLRVSIDAGPLFQPTHVRSEGDDPISLAILIDITRPDSQLLPGIADAIVGLGLGYLQPQDRVSIYAMGCRLIRSTYALPADSAKLEHSVDIAIEPLTYRNGAKPCEPTMPLWDSLERVMRDLYQQPGRRVLLAVTNGQDTGSTATWSQVGELAMQSSVTVFGVLPEPGAAGLAPDQAQQMDNLGISAAHKKYENPFNDLCELSGGVEATAGRKTLATQLGRVAQMVRERYIIEFPRSNDGVAGRHLIAVSLPGSDDYIRPSGITVPIMDRTALIDPNTLPSSAPTPQLGKRRPLPLSSPPAPPLI